MWTFVCYSTPPFTSTRLPRWATKVGYQSNLPPHLQAKQNHRQIYNITIPHHCQHHCHHHHHHHQTLHYIPQLPPLPRLSTKMHSDSVSQNAPSSFKHQQRKIRRISSQYVQPTSLSKPLPLNLNSNPSVYSDATLSANPETGALRLLQQAHCGQSCRCTLRCIASLQRVMEDDSGAYTGIQQHQGKSTPKKQKALKGPVETLHHSQRQRPARLRCRLPRKAPSLACPALLPCQFALPILQSDADDRT